MLFNSFDFALFLPLVFAVYWLVNRYWASSSNTVIVVASYVFYGWWDWRFLSLIFFSTLLDYGIARSLYVSQNQRNRKLLLWVSIVANLGLLGFFKYYHFFLQNFIDAFSFFGTTLRVSSLEIILPVGISFYTFQTLSATIDVYRRKIRPTNNLMAYAAFVSFFPQLVAGPIERATHLLPQFLVKRKFSYKKAVDGMRQILWGLFKKMVIADRCAEYANWIFANPSAFNGSDLALGALFFSFQIYGDFSGYSDMAIGTARLFGFDLKQNFAFPYFARDIAEFWRRWHISLSTWFRDYLYIPLGGSRGTLWVKVRNTFVIFLVSGFWHGANWTFVIWGGLHAVFFLPLLLRRQNRRHKDTVAQGRYFPSTKELLNMGVTFVLVAMAWVFFRAENLATAYTYFNGLFSMSLFKRPSLEMEVIWPLLALFMVVEWLGRTQRYAIENFGDGLPRTVRWAWYFLLFFVIFYWGSFQDHTFIYFQF